MARDARLVTVAAQAEQAIAHASEWLEERFDRGAADEVEGGARRFAMTLGRALEAALLVEQAQWSLDHEHDARAMVAAVRFARAGLDLVVADDALAESAALADDRPLPAG
jgi:hypothetical protein